MENNKEIIHESEVKELIIELRGEKVLIDRDVAKLYGVETKRINEAVKNNRDCSDQSAGGRGVCAMRCSLSHSKSEC